MELGRREFIVSGAVAAGALAAMGPGAARDATSGTPAVIYDPALPLARDYALARAHSARLVPVSGDRVRFWQKQFSSHAAEISGFTSWADLVILRGLAAEQGLRLRTHAALDGEAHRVFAWVLA